MLILPKGSHRNRSGADAQAALRMRIPDLARNPGELRLPASSLPAAEAGLEGYHKRVYRLYSPENLMLCNKKPKRHVSCQRRMERPVTAGIDESWSMDFMSDELFDGRRVRLLTIVDNFTRESLAIKVAAGIKGEAVRRSCYG